MKNILLVDDIDSVRNSLDIVLKSEGFHIDKCRNGQEAIERMQQDSENYDLVITDIFMPETDGMELMEHIRSQNDTVKILAISGGGSTSPERILYQAQNYADAVLKKPFNKHTLISSIRDLLDDYDLNKT